MKIIPYLILSLFVSHNIFANDSPKSEKFKVIIFDCDGVLIDNGNAYFSEWQHALQQQGYELFPDVFWKFMHENELVGSPTADEFILDFCCQLLGYYHCKETLKEDKDIYSKELHLKGFPPVLATIDFLCELYSKKDERGLKLAVASASAKEHILGNLKRIGIDHYFDLIISGHEDLIHYDDPEGVNKPKPYIYEHTAKVLGQKTNHCIVIEDSKTGVTAATAAGCFTVAIPTVATSQQNLSAANLILPSLAGISCDRFFEIVDEITSQSVPESD